MEYVVPDPKQNPKASLVVYYKVLAGFEYDDRSWDRTNFARYMRSAQALLEACGNFDIAKRCLEDLSRKFIDIGCDWNLSTVVKHSHEWKLRRGKNDGKNKQRFFDALAQQRASLATPGKGASITGGEILGPLRDLEVFQSDDWSQAAGGDSKDGGPGKRIPPDGVEAKEA